MLRGKYKEKKIGSKRSGKLKRQRRLRKPKQLRQLKRRIKKIMMEKINQMNQRSNQSKPLRMEWSLTFLSTLKKQ